MLTQCLLYAKETVCSEYDELCTLLQIAYRF